MSASSFVDNVKSLTRDTGDLIATEVRLAKAEIGEKIDQIQTGLVSVITGLLISFIAVMVLVQALVAGLAVFMEPALAALLVGGALLAIGLTFLSYGSSNLNTENMVPRRTLREAEKAGKRFREAI